MHLLDFALLASVSAVSAMLGGLVLAICRVAISSRRRRQFRRLWREVHAWSAVRRVLSEPPEIDDDTQPAMRAA
jgi:hypothetical protein